MVDYRSVSQLKEYTKCPHAYYLHRIERVTERPAAWLPMGLGVHEAAEEWEKSGRTMSVDDAQAVFRESYATHTNRLAEVMDWDYWFPSGPYRGYDDVSRRSAIGQDQVVKYIDYYTETAPQEVIWITPEGEPAIELGFNIDLDGVPVRGFIDQVVTATYADGFKPDQITIEDGDLRVRDIKTGNKPGDDFQLAVYAIAVNEMHGTEIDEGDYWMGRQGKPTKETYKLGYWTKEKVTEEFHKVDEGIRSGDFPAVPDEDNCKFCPVASACQFAVR